MKGRILIVFIIVLIVGLLFVFLQFKQQSPVSQEQNATVLATAPTSISCSGKPTIAEEEGPYYKTGSPQRSNLYNQSIPGRKFTLTGFVVDTNCNPLGNAWLDFWQADGNGHYDNSGYTLRGHQYTDTNGKFTLITVVPGEYPGRTPHIHVKIRAGNNSPIVTTQLYIPGLASNASDAIYDPTLQMHDVKTTKDGVTASFIFIVKK